MKAIIKKQTVLDNLKKKNCDNRRQHTCFSQIQNHANMYVQRNL